MRRYSTSFSLAASALPKRIRNHIDAVYAMVRIADEVVDGAWVGASPEQCLRELNRFEDVITQAVHDGFSTDLIAHAFATTARATGISTHQWTPFFASMRADIPAPSTRADIPPVAAQTDLPAESSHALAAALTPDELARYIHGSAEVIGEMCVLAFFDGTALPPAADRHLLPGARALGSAFQKVNFVRDLADDSARLQRGYLVPPGRARVDFTEDVKTRIVEEVADELALASTVIDELPRSVRPAVWTAFGVFAELNSRIAATSAEVVATTRLRVPDPVKLRIAARATAGRPQRTWPRQPKSRQWKGSA